MRERKKIKMARVQRLTMLGIHLANKWGFVTESRLIMTGKVGGFLSSSSVNRLILTCTTEKWTQMPEWPSVVQRI